MLSKSFPKFVLLLNIRLFTQCKCSFRSRTKTNLLHLCFRSVKASINVFYTLVEQLCANSVSQLFWETIKYVNVIKHFYILGLLSFDCMGRHEVRSGSRLNIDQPAFFVIRMVETSIERTEIWSRHEHTRRLASTSCLVYSLTTDSVLHIVCYNTFNETNVCSELGYLYY